MDAALSTTWAMAGDKRMVPARAARGAARGGMEALRAATSTAVGSGTCGYSGAVSIEERRADVSPDVAVVYFCTSGCGMVRCVAVLLLGRESRGEKDTI